VLHGLEKTVTAEEVLKGGLIKFLRKERYLIVRVGCCSNAMQGNSFPSASSVHSRM
jgi:hypothetical protein